MPKARKKLVNKKSSSKKTKRRIRKDTYQEDYKNRDSGGFEGLQLLDLSDFEDVKFYNVKKGENAIDIIPFEITSKNHPFKRPIGELDYKLEIWDHSFCGNLEGRILCLKKTFGKSCYICDERKRMLDSGEFSKDDDEVKDANPSRRCFYNVKDMDPRGDDDDGDVIQIFHTSHFEFQKEVIEEASYGAGGEGEVLPFAELDEGRTITFRGAKRSGGYKSMKPKSFGLEERDEEYDESILDDVYPLDAMLIIPTYEEVKKAYLGSDDTDDVEDIDDDNDVEEETDDYEDSADIEGEEIEEDIDKEEEEEEEEEKPKRQRQRSRKPNTSTKTKKKETTGKSKAKTKTSKTSKNVCIAGGTFGEDCEDYEACDECHENTPETWEACADKSGE